MLASSIRYSFFLCLLVLSIFNSGVGQKKNSQPHAPSASCSRDNAISIIQQQMDFAKTFDDDVARIAVLLRSADLLWSFKEKRARDAYLEAFELAIRNFKESGDDVKREGRLLIRKSDQRYVVIGAIAKHDSAWARRLSDQILKEQDEEDKNRPSKDITRDIATAERLLTTAISLLSSDSTAAINFVRVSLRYPATLYLARFLYELSAQDKRAADQLYQEALSMYSNAPVERLLYLSSYPFGNTRDAGDMPDYMVYQVPVSFIPNTALQRIFVQTLLRRAQIILEDPSQISSGTRVSDPDEIWLALTRLQNQIEQSLPELASSVVSSKISLAANLSANVEKDIQNTIENENRPKRGFDERIEAALKNPNVDRRDAELASTILNAGKDARLDQVLDALDKIADSSLRPALANWVFFDRTQQAINQQQLDEARKLATRVDELDQRAFLYLRIAEESLKRHPDQIQARETLEEVFDTAMKAPNTTVKARALLGVAYLYSKFDVNRAVGVLAQAVQCINQVEHPDFAMEAVIRKMEGKTFASYASFVIAGFSPNNAFREIGKLDFDNTMNLASNFSEKNLRATTTLAVAEQCLNNPLPKSIAK